MSLKLSKTFTAIFQSQKTGGLLLIICTAEFMAVANSAAGQSYLAFWQEPLLGLSAEYWLNDALMAIFFLFVGLELERDLYNGALSDFRNAMLPIFIALGGVALPAAIN